MRHSPVLPPQFPGDLSILDALFDALPPEATDPAAGSEFAATLRDLLPVDLGGSDQFDFGALGMPEDVPPADAPDLPDLPEAALALPDAASPVAIAVRPVPGPPDSEGPGFLTPTLVQDQHSDFDLADQRGGKPGGGGGGGGGNGGGGSSGATVFWTYASGLADTATVDYYNIEIDFMGDASLWGATGSVGGPYAGGLIDAFIGAADYLANIISAGLHADIVGGRLVDDIVITASLVQIDGSGGVLGQAGPQTARDANGNSVIDGLTVTGMMQFDVTDALTLLNGGSFGTSAPIDGGLWNDTVLHEMLHVLGFGTLWGVTNETLDESYYAGTPYQGVPSWDLVGDSAIFDSNNGTPRPTDDQYHYAYTGDAGALAVEANGGSGTARGHWDEYTYDNELMTGYINSAQDEDGNYNYVANFTVAALADLGYQLAGTDYDALAAAGTAFLATDDPLIA